MGRTKRVSAGYIQNYSSISINIVFNCYRFRLNDYRCNLRWSNSTTLFIGWVDTIRICVIRKRNAIEVSTRNLPGFIVDPSRQKHKFKLMNFFTHFILFQFPHSKRIFTFAVLHRYYPIKWLF